jgi:hypothetical protein
MQKEPRKPDSYSQRKTFFKDTLFSGSSCGASYVCPFSYLHLSTPTIGAGLIISGRTPRKIRIPLASVSLPSPPFARSRSALYTYIIKYSQACPPLHPVYPCPLLLIPACWSRIWKDRLADRRNGRPRINIFEAVRRQERCRRLVRSAFLSFFLRPVGPRSFGTRDPLGSFLVQRVRGSLQ